MREWLQRLAEAGVPCSVGTSTHRANIDLSMGRMRLGAFFKGAITSEDVSKGKPDPEVFLKAAALTGCPPERCVVFEDTFAGLQAARNGGMKAVGIAGTNPAKALAPHADRVVHRMDEMQPAELARWFS